MSEPIKPEVGKWYWVFCGYRDYVFRCDELGIEKDEWGEKRECCKMASEYGDVSIIPLSWLIEEHIPPRTWWEWVKGWF